MASATLLVSCTLTCTTADYYANAVAYYQDPSRCGNGIVIDSLDPVNFVIKWHRTDNITI